MVSSLVLPSPMSSDLLLRERTDMMLRTGINSNSGRNIGSSSVTSLPLLTPTMLTTTSTPITTSTTPNTTNTNTPTTTTTTSPIATPTPTSDQLNFQSIQKSNQAESSIISESSILSVPSPLSIDSSSMSSSSSGVTSIPPQTPVSQTPISQTPSLSHTPFSHTPFSHSSQPALTLSLLYPDTAPRETWRPQLDSWLKKNHPLKLKEISQISHPWIHEKLPSNNNTSSSGNVTSSIWSSSSSSLLLTSSISTSQDSPSSYPLSSSNNSLSTSSIYGKAGLSKSSTNSILPLYASSASHDRSTYPTPTSSSSTYQRSTHKINSARRSSYSSHHDKPYSRPIYPEDYEERDEHAHIHSPRLPSPPESPQLDAINGVVPTMTLEQYTNSLRRRCISCGSDQSPCWRPSWSASAGQLCNSCGLRYKKTGARCLSSKCGRIPAKGEWAAMKSVAVKLGGRLHYSCLWCGEEVEVTLRG